MIRHIVFFKLKPEVTDADRDWVFNLIRNKLPQLLTKAGYDGLATSADLAAVDAVLPDLERRCRAIQTISPRSASSSRI